MAHFLKFLVVGAIGFVINTAVLIFGVRMGFKPSVAGPAGAELAIISNFVLNNFFTFSDRRLTLEAVPLKFIQFNIFSLGSVLIQFIFLRTGEAIFGLGKFKKPFPLPRFVSKLPLISVLAGKFTAYLVFYCFGVGVGLVVNFLIYSQIIWR